MLRRIKRTDSEAGAALLEFSLIVPLVVLMFLGVVDFGIAIEDGMRVVDAARAGAEAGVIPPNVSNIPTMQTAATNVGGSLPGFTVVASRWCSCTPGGSVSSCTSWCGSSIPIKYVEVDTTASVPVLMGYPGIPSNFSLTGLAILRIQ